MSLIILNSDENIQWRRWRLFGQIYILIFQNIIFSFLVLMLLEFCNECFCMNKCFHNIFTSLLTLHIILILEMSSGLTLKISLTESFVEQFMHKLNLFRSKTYIRSHVQFLCKHTLTRIFLCKKSYILNRR